MIQLVQPGRGCYVVVAKQPATLGSNLVLHNFYFDFILAGDDEEVEDLEETHGVYNQYSHKPIFLLKLGGFPESQTLPDERPKDEDSAEDRVGTKPPKSHIDVRCDVHGYIVL